MSRANIDAEKDALFLRSIVENIPYMIFVKDARDLRFVRFNKAGEELLGYSREELIGKNDYDFFPKGEADFFNRNDRTVLDGKTPVDIPEEPIQTRHRGLRYLHTKKIPILDENGVPQYLLGISEDITEIKKVYAELRQAKENAEAASHAKTDFCARMSHEIRTPMNGIIGMTELALETTLTDEQKEYLTLVRDSAESLLALLNDVLDFSKIEAGKLGLAPSPIKLRPLVEKTVKTFSLAAERKGVDLVTWLADDLPDVVKADPARLRQVFVNLLDNAVRFTEKGRITVTASVKEQMKAATLVQFSVRDTGIGIPKNQRDAIFESFTQVNGSATRRHGGSGLGLTISARIAEVLGGRLWLDPQTGEGSTFHFTALLEHCAESPARAVGDSDPLMAAYPKLRPLRVLVAEDNRVNLLLTARILEREGHSVEVASTGTQALGALKRGPFDAVLMDVEMPDMGGLEATRRIREMERVSGEHVPIIALTAHAMPGYRERCLDAGMDDYLAKPIRRATLFATIARVVPNAEVGATRSAESKQDTEDLLQTFLRTTRKDIEEIQKAFSKQQLDRVGIIAHGIAGAAHIIGAPAAAAVAQRISASAKAGDQRQAAALVPDLKAEVNRLQES